MSRDKRENRWIVVPNWGRFQHYGMARRPPWIKNYTALLHDDEYLDLPLSARGLLHGIWLAYADRKGRIRAGRDMRDTLQLRGRLDHDLLHIASLSHAGFIELSASRPLDLDLKPKKQGVREDQVGAQERRRRAASNWIRNGLAREVPAHQLADVFSEDFKITEPSIVVELIAQAQEWNRG